VLWDGCVAYKKIEVKDVDFEIKRELEIAAKRVEDLRDSL